MKCAMIPALSLLSALADPACASGLFNQPADFTTAFASQNDPIGFGSFATAYDNFMMGTTGTIGGVSWTGGYWNGYSGSPPAITGWTISILDDNAGQPGAVLNTTVVAGTANETPLGDFNGVGFFSYSSALGTQFVASAATTYWFSVVPTVGFPPQWGMATATGGDGKAAQDFLGSRGVLNNDLAFALHAPAAVPEPSQAAASAVMVAGLTGCAMRRRRVK